LLAGLFAAALPAAAQERAMVPVTVDGETVKLAVITYKPNGPGRFPTLIFHHGSTGRGFDPSLFARPYDPRPLAEWFTARGWAVVLPSRRGRGGSEGLYDEGFSSLGRAKGYTCEEPLSLAGADRALRDLDVITPAILAQPFVDRSKVAVGGQSRGGILAVAWSGRRPDVPRAVVNFVGGWLGTGCWSASAVNQNLFNRGAAFARPTIWLYGDRDPFYPLTHSRANFAAFEAAGGKGAFHDYAPPEGLTGHQISSAPQLWGTTLESFLTGQGLPVKAP
jgi:dienelactone hydrolase